MAKAKLGQEEFVDKFIEVVGLDGTKGTFQDVADAMGLVYGSVIQRFTKYTKSPAEGGYGINLPTPRRQGGGQRVNADKLNARIAAMAAEAAKAAEAAE